MLLQVVSGCDDRYVKLSGFLCDAPRLCNGILGERRDVVCLVLEEAQAGRIA